MHKILFGIILCCSFITGSVLAQAGEVLKRVPYKLTVVVDKKTVYEEDLPESPFVSPGKTIQLYPGETVFVEVEQEAGMIKTLKAVKEIRDSSKTLTIRFIQSVNKNKHQSMLLSIHNPFPQNLAYRAKIFRLNATNWQDAGVYPVFAGLSAYESWPDVITSIGLGEFVFR